MSKYLLTLTLSAWLMFLVGCDTERVTSLEKENQELKEKIQKQENAAADLDSQAKCGRDAKIYFHENWPSDEKTMNLDFTNHYNRSLNKCFVLVSDLFWIKKNSQSAFISVLQDVYENDAVGQFSQTEVNSPDKLEGLTLCKVADAKCTAVKEFNDLVHPYMIN